MRVRIFINDISSLGAADMADVVNRFRCSIILMRQKPLQKDKLLESLRQEFMRITTHANEAGINKNKLILDPGLGFGDVENEDYSLLPGSDIDANMQLCLGSSQQTNLPVLIGASRKRFIGELTNQPTKFRDTASAIIAAQSIKKEQCLCVFMISLLLDRQSLFCHTLTIKYNVRN